MKMKSRAIEWALKELEEAREKRSLKMKVIADIRERAKFDQVCVDTSDEVKKDVASEHEFGEFLHRLEIDALDIKIESIGKMLINQGKE